MTALVVRRNTDHGLVCFGPNNGQYDPGYDPATMTKAVESDYNAVLAEWQAAHPAPPTRDSLKTVLRSARTLPELVAALDAFL